jgi:hypothetical protein
MSRQKHRARTNRTTPTRARAREHTWRDAVTKGDARERLERCLSLLRIHGIINVACRQAQFAGKSLSKSTFYEMRASHPDFEREVQEAMGQAVEELEADGMACARLARKDPRYLPMLKFALQVKAGWTPKERVEHVGAGGGPIRVAKTEMTEEQAAEMYRKALNE